MSAIYCIQLISYWPSKFLKEIVALAVRLSRLFLCAYAFDARALNSLSRALGLARNFRKRTVRAHAMVQGLCSRLSYHALCQVLSFWNSVCVEVSSRELHIKHFFVSETPGLEIIMKYISSVMTYQFYIVRY